MDGSAHGPSFVQNVVGVIELLVRPAAANQVECKNMDLLQLVKQERDRLNKVIALLEPGASTSNSTPSKHTGASASNSAPRKPKVHKWTDEERKAMSIKQKALWAKKRKAKG
jgi:hypothetical protein